MEVDNRPHEFDATAEDTPADVEARQVDGWRRMTDREKAAVITGLTGASFAMALAGLRQRHPDRSPREHLLRLAVITHGRELATKAYPEILELDIL